MLQTYNPAKRVHVPWIIDRHNSKFYSPFEHVQLDSPGSAEESLSRMAKGRAWPSGRVDLASRGQASRPAEAFKGSPQAAGCHEVVLHWLLGKVKCEKRDCKT